MTDPVFTILPIAGPDAPDPFKNPGIVPPWLREPKSVPRRDCGFAHAANRVVVELPRDVVVAVGELEHAGFDRDVAGRDVELGGRDELVGGIGNGYANRAEVVHVG